MEFAASPEASPEDAWLAWLGTKLDALELERDVYTEYVTGIMADDADAVDSAAQQAAEMIDGAAESDVDTAALEADLVNQWRLRLSAEAALRNAGAAARDEARSEAALKAEKAAVAAAAEAKAAAKDKPATDVNNSWIAKQYGAEVEEDEGGGDLADGVSSNKAGAVAFMQQKKEGLKQAHLKNQVVVKASQTRQKELKAAAEARKSVKQERKPRG
ncbi:hypothetical protein M885DRAFT_521755 [Pelagophyceae sp. CCMP2097]|nr:hypothetical protein M885DRAFT_521755 [Pelagophyceae sp. CCMP2097]